MSTGESRPPRPLHPSAPNGNFEQGRETPCCEAQFNVLDPDLLVSPNDQLLLSAAMHARPSWSRDQC